MTRRPLVAGPGRSSLAAVAVVLTTIVLLLSSAATPSASAATPARTDILLVFDTTGSMDGALDAARDKVDGLVAQLSSRLPDVQYGLAEVRDHELYGAFEDQPYTLRQGITADVGALKSALSGLEADGGGDNAEAYGTALLSADLGTGGVNWRPGARRLVVLIADEMPHDDDLNLDIPEELQVRSSPFDTEIDPGFDGVVGTPDDVDWQPLLTRMANNGIPLLYVLFEGPDEYLPYWKLWAGRTGGAATDADDGDLDTKVVELATAAATGELPPCPEGQSRNADGACAVVTPVAPPPPPAPAPAPAPAPSSNPFSHAWTGITAGISSAQACDGEVADVGNDWRVIGKTARCVGSGQVFFDDEFKGKAQCIVNVGATIIPVGKILAAGKLAKKFADEAADAVGWLRKLKLSPADKKLVDDLDIAGTAWSAVSAGSIVGGGKVVLEKLLTSRKSTAELVKRLKTSHASKDIQRLKRVQESADKLFTAVSGIDDAIECKKAFS